MSVSLTYDDTLSRVVIDADGLAAADYATVERSTDQIRWTVIRGGGNVSVTAGAFDLPVSDYEFEPGVENFYRVRGVETDAITYVASGAVSFDANAAGTSTLAPALPAGLVAGDLMILHAAIRNSGTGTVNVPSGWTLMAQNGNQSLIGRYYVAGDAAPTVSFAGGVANATVGARIHAFRSTSLVPVKISTQLNASAQNIDYPAFTTPAENMLLINAVWKQDDWTSKNVTVAFTEIDDSSSTLGDDEALGFDYQIQTSILDVASFFITVTGGAAAISRATMLALEHAAYLNSQESSVTPVLTATWLKSLAHPFLNRAVQEMFRPDTTVTTPSRSGLFEVIGRTNPIAITTVRSSRRWTMYVRTTTQQQADDLDLMLASGDVLLVQAPDGCMTQTGYVAVGDVSYTRHPLRPAKRLYTLPMTAVAPPGPGVLGSLGTWQTVLNTYATWADVMAANATWADLLELVGDPSEVLVP